MKSIRIFMLILLCFCSCKKETKKQVEILNTLTDTELKTKTADELRFLRNEVFARKGYVFISDDLKKHFTSKDWYRPVLDTMIQLTNDEKDYINKIKGIELSLGANLENNSIKNTKKTKEYSKNDTIENKIKKEKVVYKGIMDTTYAYKDTSGKYSLVLSRGEFKQSLYSYCVKKDSLSSELTWKLRDFLNEQESTEDYSIEFLKSYINLKDFDKDGLIEPILIYTTKGYDGYEKSRLKIIIRYKNSKIAIRHQNALLDDERETKIDEGYHNLPPVIKTEIKKIMLNLMENKYALFNSNVLNRIGG